MIGELILQCPFCAEKDAEIEGLKARVEALRQIREEDKALITELCKGMEVLAHELNYNLQSMPQWDYLLQRAREATR